MIFDKDTANNTAEQLLRIKAIKLQPNDPFTWASGWKSPIYCDNRITLSYPDVRNFLRTNMAKTIEEKFGKPDVIAGVATGAIAIGVLVAQELGIPFVYVRPKPKEHGRKNQVEGHLEKGSNVVVVEDLISTGKSSLQAVEALKGEDVNIKGMMAIFTYGFPVATQNFEEANIELSTLSDYKTLIEQAEKDNYITSRELGLIQTWRKNPAEWTNDED